MNGILEKLFSHVYLKKQTYHLMSMARISLPMALALSASKMGCWDFFQSVVDIVLPQKIELALIKSLLSHDESLPASVAWGGNTSATE